MFILVINAGSSSLKYQLVDKQTQEVIAKGLCEKVGADDSFHTYELGETEATVSVALADHHAAVQAVLETLLDPQAGVVKALGDIAAVGHRVVHGGEYFSASVVIDDDVIAKIGKCVSLAPLHNPPSLMGIEACTALLPAALQVAVFDTAFHQTLPPRAYMYPLPYEFYEQHKIRRYGFHGTSHRYVVQRAAELLNRPLEEMKIVSCHLGNGCSLTAVDKGLSVDNSMGFTPLDGVMMGTRCGSIDPAIVLYLQSSLGLGIEETDAVLNRKSGLLGISGISNDLRDIRAAADAGNERAKLAYEMAANSIKRFIGQYVFELGGVDAIILCGGVGENDDRMRSMVFAGLEPLGIILDEDK
ncbi:MAG: acetate kinase, partial [Coriobacteriales bacterium]|nr:acetate kinase [Coriobacteriales bacterium]